MNIKKASIIAGSTIAAFGMPCHAVKNKQNTVQHQTERGTPGHDNGVQNAGRLNKVHNSLRKAQLSRAQKKEQEEDEEEEARAQQATNDQKVPAPTDDELAALFGQRY